MLQYLRNPYCHYLPTYHTTQLVSKALMGLMVGRVHRDFQGHGAFLGRLVHLGQWEYQERRECKVHRGYLG